ncbi:hypothetical protein ACJX0J_011271 [Zea mays]
MAKKNQGQIIVRYNALNIGLFTFIILSLSSISTILSLRILLPIAALLNLGLEHSIVKLALICDFPPQVVRVRIVLLIIDERNIYMLLGMGLNVFTFFAMKDETEFSIF